MTTSLTLAQAILTLHLKKKKILIIHYFNFVAFYRAKPQPRCTEHSSHWEFFSLRFLSFPSLWQAWASTLHSFFYLHLNREILMRAVPLFICTLCTNKTKWNATEHAQIRETSTTQRFFFFFFFKVYFSVFFRGRELIQHCISSQKVVSINRSHQYVQY